MEGLSLQLIQLLQYLLPGFVTAWIFYSLTSYPKPSQFERVVQALIFTFLIQTIVKILKFLLEYFCTFSHLEIAGTIPNPIWSLFTAIIMGSIFCWFIHNDRAHAFFRVIKCTRETSFPSQWFGAFANNLTYVVLHLEGERRLYGRPIEWPSVPTEGHFLISEASWLSEDGQIDLLSVEFILIDVKDVKFVEFMRQE